MAEFIHLHVHSAYSLAESAIPTSRLADLCKNAETPAVAVTDSNNLFGALEISEMLAAKGVQPIVGIELQVFHGSNNKGCGKPEAPSHVVLLAQNAVGYQRLMAIASASFLDSASQETPCVDLDQLCKQTDGLLCLTGGWNGPVDRLLDAGQADAAAQMLDRLAKAFPHRLYVELQRAPDSDFTDAQGAIGHESDLVNLAYQQNLPIIATNNVYFPHADDHEAHDVLLCIAEGSYISQDERRKVPRDFWFKPASAMAELFKDLPEAVANTVQVARRCAFRPRTAKPLLPSFAGDQDREDEALEEAALKGLRQRLDNIVPAAPVEAYEKRLEHELGVIKRMGFSGYFLIVADFIQWAKSQGIPVGPGRGSGAGSLVAYALTVTDLDPMRFGLLFERFLNPERVSMPDFDIDFCQERRDEVIRYVRSKYGDDRVAQIITFGKLQARAVLRDVGRVMQMPFGQVDRLCKMVPNNPANPVTLAQAVAGEPRFEDEKRNDPQVGILIEIALKLEGLYRHASTHAAGVVIGDRPLQEIVPLYIDPRADMPATQFNMKWVEPAGLVKFDFLGLKTLTVIKRAVDNLQAEKISLDIDRVPTDDTLTFQMLTRGESTGVFQLESSGMRTALKGMKPDSLEDIIALVSLYRPGPMDNIPTYNARKAGDEKPDYLHPMLEGVLRETFGVIIYQEQVMQIAQILSGYSLGEADLLRRAMGKKKKKEMDQQKARFIEGAKGKGVDPYKAESIFDLVAKFAGYGFNKCHAAPYAWISYQTAYLKAHQPAAFLAASMSLDLSNTDKLAVFHAEARRAGVKINPPCLNKSGADFFARGGEIFYALGAVKSVGFEAVRCIEKVRQSGGLFQDLFDFAERVDCRQIGKRGIEQLARAGAFDALHSNRAEVMAAADMLIRHSGQIMEEVKSGQGGLFGGLEGGTIRPTLSKRTPWSAAEKLDEERVAIGFYLSGHPLSEFRQTLADQGVAAAAPVVTGEIEQAGATLLAGVVRSITNRRSKSGKPFAWIVLSDESCDYEVTAFSEVLERHRDVLSPGTPLLASVSVDEQAGSIRLTLESVRPLSRNVDRERETASLVDVTVSEPDALSEIRASLRACAKMPDSRALRLVLPLTDQNVEVVVEVPSDFQVGDKSEQALRVIRGVSEVRSGM